MLERRTDLALEARELRAGASDLPGVSSEEGRAEAFPLTTVRVTSRPEPGRWESPRAPTTPWI